MSPVPMTFLRLNSSLLSSLNVGKAFTVYNPDTLGTCQQKVLDKRRIFLIPWYPINAGRKLVFYSLWSYCVLGTELALGPE